MAAARLTRRRAAAVLALGAACAMPPAATAQMQAYGLAARVNGAPITVERLERNFDEYLREKQINISALRSPARAKRLKREALDLLIDQELLWQEARRSAIEATPQEVAAAVAAVRGGFSSPQAFAGRLEAEGYTETTYAEHMHRLLSARKVLERAAASVEVSDAAIHEFYAHNAAQFVRPEQMQLRHLYLAFASDASDAQKAAARTRMREILAAARAGTDFAALARDHSQGSSAAQGGDLGFVQREELARPLADAAFALAAGAVSEIVELPDGLHLLKAEQRIAAERLPEAAYRERIRAHLQEKQSQQARSAALRRLRADAKIEVLLPLPPVDAAAADERSPAERARAAGR